MTTIHSRWIQPGWYLAVCETCQPVLPQPFRDKAKRDTWADEHGATGHTVTQIDGDLPAESVKSRGICPHCGRDKALRNDGTLVVHYPQPVQPPSSERCPGSHGTQPQQAR